jgi:hypothetical protein
MHNIPFQFVAFVGFHSFYSLLQYKQTQLILNCEIQVLQAKGQDSAYLFYYLLLWHSPVNTRLHYALNYTVNIIQLVPHIPPMVTQQPQRADMMEKYWRGKKILY